MRKGLALILTLAVVAMLVPVGIVSLTASAAVENSYADIVNIYHDSIGGGTTPSSDSKILNCEVVDGKITVKVQLAQWDYIQFAQPVTDIIHSYDVADYDTLQVNLGEHDIGETLPAPNGDTTNTYWNDYRNAHFFVSLTDNPDYTVRAVDAYWQIKGGSLYSGNVSGWENAMFVKAGRLPGLYTDSNKGYFSRNGSQSFQTRGVAFPFNFETDKDGYLMMDSVNDVANKFSVIGNNDAEKKANYDQFVTMKDIDDVFHSLGNGTDEECYDYSYRPAENTAMYPRITSVRPGVNVYSICLNSKDIGEGADPGPGTNPDPGPGTNPDPGPSTNPYADIAQIYHDNGDGNTAVSANSEILSCVKENDKITLKVRLGANDYIQFTQGITNIINSNIHGLQVNLENHELDTTHSVGSGYTIYNDPNYLPYRECNFSVALTENADPTVVTPSAFWELKADKLYVPNHTHFGNAIHTGVGRVSTMYCLFTQDNTIMPARGVAFPFHFETDDNGYLLMKSKVAGESQFGSSDTTTTYKPVEGAEMYVRLTSYKEQVYNIRLNFADSGEGADPGPGTNPDPGPGTNPDPGLEPSTYWTGEDVTARKVEETVIGYESTWNVKVPAGKIGFYSTKLETPANSQINIKLNNGKFETPNWNFGIGFTTADAAPDSIAGDMKDCGYKTIQLMGVSDFWMQAFGWFDQDLRDSIGGTWTSDLRRHFTNLYVSHTRPDFYDGIELKFVNAKNDVTGEKHWYLCVNGIVLNSASEANNALNKEADVYYQFDEFVEKGGHFYLYNHTNNVNEFCISVQPKVPEKAPEIINDWYFEQKVKNNAENVNMTTSGEVQFPGYFTTDVRVTPGYSSMYTKKITDLDKATFKIAPAAGEGLKGWNIQFGFSLERKPEGLNTGSMSDSYKSFMLYTGSGVYDQGIICPTTYMSKSIDGKTSQTVTLQSIPLSACSGNGGFEICFVQGGDGHWYLSVCGVILDGAAIDSDKLHEFLWFDEIVEKGGYLYVYNGNTDVHNYRVAIQSADVEADEIDEAPVYLEDWECFVLDFRDALDNIRAGKEETLAEMKALWDALDYSGQTSVETEFVNDDELWNLLEVVKNYSAKVPDDNSGEIEPPADEEPVEDEAPVVDETPVIDETPIVEEESDSDNFGEGDGTTTDEGANTNTTTKKTKATKPAKTEPKSGVSPLLVVGIAIAVVMVAGAVVLLVYLKKKQSKNAQ